MAGVRMVVSVHDVAPPTASAARRWARLLDPIGVPLTFLVVPGPWRGARFGDRSDDGGDLAAWLRGRQEIGDEVSVHGWCHRADVPGPRLRHLTGTLAARGAGEFWALDRVTARRRTADGVEVLDRHGLVITGTTPPGWLSSAAARAGYADAGLAYVTDHVGVTHLPSGRRWRAPALCHRPAAPDTRRHEAAAVLEGAGRRMLTAAPGLVAAGVGVRIGLHPDDLLRPGLAEAAVRAVRGALAAGAVATTYAQVVRPLARGSRVG